MPTYRCYCCTDDAGNAGRDFEAAAAPGRPVACPACGEPHAGVVRDPDGVVRAAGHVALVEEIHFDEPRNARRGRGHAACDKKLRVGGVPFTALGTGGAHFTGEPAAVTCKACMATDAFRKAAAARGVPAVPPGLDVPVILSPATGVVSPPADTAGGG